MSSQEQSDADWPDYQQYASHRDDISYDTYPGETDMDADVSDLGTTASSPLRHSRPSHAWIAWAASATLVFLWFLGLLVTLQSHRATVPAGKSTHAATPVPTSPAPSATSTAVSGGPVTPLTIAQLAEGVVRILAFEAPTSRTAQNRPASVGTGFIVDGRGYIVTNEHVIRGGTQIIVFTHDGSRHTASVVTADPKIDIAILKLTSGSSLRVLSLGNSEAAQLGERVYVLGFPLSEDIGNAITVSDGLLSSMQYHKDEKWFQTSAPVNPGNSGGPLILAASGKVIGVVTAKVAEAESIAFARPVDSIHNLLARSLP